MNDARSLLTQQAGSHAGQILYRGLPGFEAGEGADHVSRVAQINATDAYQPGFERFERSMKAIGAVTGIRTTQHPVVIGTGVASPIEVGITLLATYGVPFVPGESLKNVARRAAAEFEGDPLERAHAIEQVFGAPGLAGGIQFWGGWVLPDQRALAPDVITPHHSAYYSSAGGVPPTDFDDPNPVSFLVMPPGIQVLFAVGSATAGSWAKLAWQFADYGLCHLGVGAKGNVGYGTFANGQGPHGWIPGQPPPSH